MDTMLLPEKPDYIAPDASEIRLLPSFASAGLSHCKLKPGKTSKAVRHRTVEEIWYVLQGRGEVWRRYGSTETLLEVASGSALIVPFQTHFQFRNIGDDDLAILIVTIPGWPGPEEAVEVVGKWRIEQ
jgi:mannose-6-phosphate isomerase-like protein (cupin superfamily)